jgi:hypothetical protein
MAMYEISIRIVFLYCMFYNMILTPLPTGSKLVGFIQTKDRIQKMYLPADGSGEARSVYLS